MIKKLYICTWFVVLGLSFYSTLAYQLTLYGLNMGPVLPRLSPLNYGLFTVITLEVLSLPILVVSIQFQI